MSRLTILMKKGRARNAVKKLILYHPEWLTFLGRHKLGSIQLDNFSEGIHGGVGNRFVHKKKTCQVLRCISILDKKTVSSFSFMIGALSMYAMFN